MKLNLTWKDIQDDCVMLAANINVDYDLIVGVARGGLIPAVMLSHLLKNQPVLCIGTSSYNEKHEQGKIKIYQEILPEKFVNKKVLIVEDLTDTGTTLQTLKNYYKMFDNVLLNTAVLYIKSGSTFIPDYYCHQIPKEKWIVFPYELN